MKLVILAKPVRTKVLPEVSKWPSPKWHYPNISKRSRTVPGKRDIIGCWWWWIAVQLTRGSIQQGNQYANLTQTNGISLHGTMCQVHTDMGKQESEQNEWIRNGSETKEDSDGAWNSDRRKRRHKAFWKPGLTGVKNCLPYRKNNARIF